MSRVGFIGAGRIGAPMVARLAGAGHEVRALGRSAEKCAAVRKLGAAAVRTVEEAAEDADIAIVCVFTDEQVQHVCLESDLIAAMKPGSVLVVHTTGSPHTVEAIAARADRRFIDVVDAPVSGGPHDVAAGQVTIFVGGGDDAVAQVRPVLSSYGDPVLHVGPLGVGQRVKLLNNLLFAAQIGLVSETVQLGSLLGIVEIHSAGSTHTRQSAPHSPRSPPRAQPRRLSRRSATSSARTSRWSEKPSPNWGST